MACGCKGKGVTSYAYVAPDGQITEKKTEVEARAMLIRNGNEGEVKPVKA